MIKTTLQSPSAGVITCLLICILISHSINGQSPDVAAANKFARNPVGLYSGAPNIGIPLSGIDSRSLTIGVGLNYHPGGITVDEYGSSVGLGWSLAVGGMISRVIEGIDDFGTNGYLAQAIPDLAGIDKDCSANSGDQYLSVTDILNDERDSSPDLFYFSFPGGAGKFIFDASGKPFVLDQFGIKITAPPTNTPQGTWTITTLDGLIYTFGGTGRTELQDGEVTAWYLEKITALTGEIATFNYQSASFSYSLPDLKTQHHLLDADAGATCGSYTIDEPRSFSLNVLYPSSILLQDSEIEFTTSSRCDLPGARKIDKIRFLHNNGQLLKEYRFSYDCDVLKKRLWLLSVQQLGSDGTPVRPTKFTYYNRSAFPGVGSAGQDHWGFYNGAGNSDLRPTFNLSPTLFYSGADRDTHTERVKYGSLSMIEHASGGITEYEFESHNYEPYAAGQTYSEAERTPAVCLGGFAECLGDNNSYTESFTLVRETDIQVSYDLKRALPLDNGNPTKALVYVRPQGSVLNEFYRELTILGEDSDQNISITLEAGNYVIGADLVGSSNPLQNGQKAFIELSYIDIIQDITPQHFSYGGGLRIKKITSSDGQGLNPPVVKRYEYKNPDTGNSSGKLMSCPQYYYYTDELNIETSGTTNCTYLVMTSSSVVPLTTSANGSYVGYDFVMEYEGQDTDPDQGRVIYEYYNAADQPNAGITLCPELPSNQYVTESLPYAPPTVVEAKKGYLKEVTTERRNATSYYPIEKITHHYTDTPVNSIPGWLVYGKVDTVHLLTPQRCKYIKLAQFDYISSLIQLNSTTSIRYDGEGAATGNAFSNVATYTYDAQEPYLLKSSEQNDGDRDLIRKIRRVTDSDFADTDMSGMIGVIKAKNLLGTVIDRQLWIREAGTEKILSSDISLYDQVNGVVVPQYSYRASLENPVNSTAWSNYTGTGTPNATYYEKILTNIYNSADATLIERNDKTGQAQSWVYGYDDVVPIAEVSNAHQNEIAYSSFETGALGNWESLVTGNMVSNDGKTGQASYTGSLSKCCLPAGKTYTVALWAKGAAQSITVGGILKNTDANWKYYTWEGLPGGTINVTNTGAQLDEVRVHPDEAFMQTYVLQPDIGISSVTGTNGQSTYFEYDGLQRRKLTRDQDGNVVDRFSYRFRGVPGTIENGVPTLSVPVNFQFAGGQERNDLTFAWNFGDGSASQSGRSVDHSFIRFGDLMVTLTISDGSGVIDTYQKEVFVNGTLQGSISVTDRASRQLSVTAANNAPNPAGTTYTWDFGEPGSERNGVNTIYTFDRLGTKTITLTIDHPQFTALELQVQHLLPGALIVNAINPQNVSVAENANITFTAAAFPTNPPHTQYSWNFGDGSPESSSGTHRFQVMGNYTVSLKARHADYADSSPKTAQVTVTYGTPVLDQSSISATIDYQSPGDPSDDIFTLSCDPAKYGETPHTYFWESQTSAGPWVSQGTSNTPQKSFNFSAPTIIRVRARDQRNVYSNYIQQQLLIEFPR